MTKRATYEDVLNAPENRVAEILDGELILSPLRPLRHAHAFGRLLAALGRHFDTGQQRPGGWWIVPGVEFHIDGDVLVPDISGWRRERLPAIPNEPWMTLAPDWVCEVLYPAVEPIDRGRKLRIYAAAGVPNAWLLNPVERTLEVLRLRDGQWMIVDVLTGEEPERAEPFDSVPLALGELWSDL